MKSEYENLSLYEGIKKGIDQCIEYEKGDKKQASETMVSFIPLPNYTAAEIKSIRNRAGMTQSYFARYMGISKKTVESWEGGLSNPTGPARRLLSVLDENPQLAVSLFYPRGKAS